MANHRSALAALLKGVLGRTQGVYVHLPLVEVLGGWANTIVFSDLTFWHEYYERPVYKSAREIGESLYLGTRTVERSIAQLKTLGVIIATVEKASGAPTNHFSVDYERLADLVSEAQSRQNGGDPEGRFRQNGGIQDSAKMAESITEATYRKNEKHTSSDDDARAEAKASSEEGRSRATAKASSSQEVSSSLGTPPSSAAPPHQLAEEIVATYNELRGGLAKAGVLNDKRLRAIASFVKEAKRLEMDPVETVRAATLEVAKDDYWRQKHYGLDNLLRHVFEKAEKAVASAPVVSDLTIGHRVSWASNSNVSHSPRRYGTVAGFDERNYPVIDVDPGQQGIHYSRITMNPERLRVEDAEE